MSHDEVMRTGKLPPASYDPSVLPRAGQAAEALPATLNSMQARCWIGLTHTQWYARRSRKEIRTAEVWGTRKPHLRYWTSKLAALVPQAA